jgi:hypothetical protein
MALAAYYAKQRNEEVEQVDEISDKKKREYLDKALDWSHKKWNEPAKPEHITPSGRKLKKSWTDSSEYKKGQEKMTKRREIIQKTAKSVTGKKHFHDPDTGLNYNARTDNYKYTKETNESLAVPLIGSKDDDESAEMAKTQLRALANKALHLVMQLSDDQVVEPWVQAKIAVAKDNVSAVHDYMVFGNHDKPEDEQTTPYEGGIDMTGAPRNTYPNFSVDVNTGRNV